MILQNLGQALPSKLEYLCLELKLNIDDFKVFLENSENTFIKKLLINMHYGRDPILSCLREHIIKKKNIIKYLSLSRSFESNVNSKNAEKVFDQYEIKIFESYNVKFQQFKDLKINCYKFIKEMYC